MRDFLEANEARLKDKHFLYVVGTNLEEDTYLRRGNTRGSKYGINVKIGMSQSGVTARLKNYTHMSSNFDPRFPESGIRVPFLTSTARSIYMIAAGGFGTKRCLQHQNDWTSCSEPLPRRIISN